MWIGSRIRLTARQPYASPPGYQSRALGDNVPDLGSQDTTGAQPHHGSAPPSPCHNNDNLVNSTPCLLLSCTHREDANASPVSQSLSCLFFFPSFSGYIYISYHICICTQTGKQCINNVRKSLCHVYSFSPDFFLIFSLY